MTSLQDFSIALEKNLDWKEKDPQSDLVLSPVELLNNGDGNLLRCARPECDEDRMTGSLLGIEENRSFFRGGRGRGRGHGVPAQDECIEEEDLVVKVELFRPALDSIRSIVNGCLRNHPCSDWTRRPRRVISIAESNAEELIQTESIQDANINFIDLARLQKLRRSNRDCDFQIDSPGKICHLLRSTLRNSGNKCMGDNKNPASSYNPHFASPWSDRDDDHDAMSCYQSDHVIGILLCNQLEEGDTITHKENVTSRNSEYWNSLEKRELFELCKFRTGDACPSFYTYSISKLRSDFVLESLVDCPRDCELSNLKSENGYTLIIYRVLPPREHFMDSSNDAKVKLPMGCLFEKLKVLTENPESQEANYRIVAPPYQCHKDIYPGLMDQFMKPANIASVLNEAKRIPLWTAWPERNHYQSDYDNDSDPNDSTYPASWTVFPLCYTFPASDPSATKWISKTCAFVPETTRLLKDLGPILRTALFSRLDPHTTLGSHTGWADLANHVLRVHIPLVIPKGEVNAGLCGTWVDGLVETHQEGKIICFDDSKTHRAFNYSGEERIVLIIDLARPSDCDFPGGTASGGHTNELDSFIEQFS